MIFFFCGGLLQGAAKAGPSANGKAGPGAGGKGNKETETRRCFHTNALPSHSDEHVIEICGGFSREVARQVRAAAQREIMRELEREVRERRRARGKAQQGLRKP
jgi:hypothetical protein